MDGTTGGWFDREIAGCSLVDRRLEKRLRNLLELLGHAMGASIPLACQDWANTKAAYRFFSNERISEAAILAGHFAATRERFAATDGPSWCCRIPPNLPSSGSGRSGLASPIE